MSRRWFCLALLASALAPAWSAQPDDTWSGVERIVAIGDVHGDDEAFLYLLRSAGVVNAQGHWTGGKTHLVQTGDVLDRGPHSLKCLDILMALESEAREAGGYVHSLLGNHETMNLYGDLRYVNPAEYSALRDANSERLRNLYYDQYLKRLRANPPPEGSPAIDDNFRRKWDSTHPLGYFEYVSLFAPDAKYGRWLRTHPAVIKINDVLFLHGGISPKYAKTKIKDINKQVARELEDFTRLEGGIVNDPEGPLWYRGLEQLDEGALGPLVQGIMERLDVNYIVVGHTPTHGYVTPRANGHVLCIDTGLSTYYGAHRACLILENGKQYAIQQGNRLDLPRTPVDMARYLRDVADADSRPR